MKPAIFLLIISLGMLTSCYHVYYAPNTANVPLLSQKKEFRLNALYSAGGLSEFSGGEVQLAYAVSDHWGIMVNGMSVGSTENVTELNFLAPDGSHTESGKGNYLEAAGGYFQKLDPKGKWMGEIYSGIGLGSAENDYGYKDNSRVNTTKFFVQPGIGYKTRNFEFGFSPKLSLISWNVKNKNLSSGHNDYIKSELDFIGSRKSFLAIEPAFIFRAGGESFKIQCSLSFSNTSATEGLAETLNGSIGFSLNLR
jgi:hypothetical protein